MKKYIIIAILIAIGSLSGIIFLLRGNGWSSNSSTINQSNVSIQSGKQVIQIEAKGGYAPRKTVAKANVPTTLMLNTRGTFDCSSAISIPSLGYRATLPATGITPIEIPPQSSGTTIKGLCAMGMYQFAINFTE
jgi:plastocyanin domain-containing protein